MDETPEQLQRTIATKHEELNSNLTALDAKAKELIDWRAQFEARPLVVLGAAFAGGVIVAALLGGSRSRRRDANDYRPILERSSAPALHREENTWHRLRDAVGVVATGAAMELINKAVPGLTERLIDPIREHMAREDGAATMRRGSSAFAAPPPARTNGYNAPDAT
jgi:hypothetical protein